MFMLLIQFHSSRIETHKSFTLQSESNVVISTSWIGATITYVFIENLFLVLATMEK